MAVRLVKEEDLKQVLLPKEQCPLGQRVKPLLNSKRKQPEDRMFTKISRYDEFVVKDYNVELIWQSFLVYDNLMVNFIIHL